MNVLMANHIARACNKMLSDACGAIEDRLRIMLKTVKLDMENSADDLLREMIRDYRGALGGGDVPDGEIMPRWQWDLHKAAMAETRKAEKVFKKAAVLLPEDDDMPMDEGAPFDDEQPVDAQSNAKNPFTPESNDEPMTTVEDPVVNQEVKVKTEADPTSRSSNDPVEQKEDVKMEENEAESAHPAEEARTEKTPVAKTSTDLKHSPRLASPLIQCGKTSMETKGSLDRKFQVLSQIRNLDHSEPKQDIDHSGIAFDDSPQKVKETSPGSKENDTPSWGGGVLAMVLAD